MKKVLGTLGLLYLAFSVMPLGSANDYANALGLGPDWWRRPDPNIRVRPVDVGVLRAPDGRSLYFINGMGLGFNGFVTREARRITSLRGIPLYGLAVLRAMKSSYRFPELSLRISGAEAVRMPTLSMSLGLGQREGNFRLTPDALLDDGLFDYLHVGKLPRRRLLRYVPRMISGNIPRNDPEVTTGRCNALEVESASPLMAHADGEFFCQPEEKVYRLNVDLLPGRLRVLGRWP
jgi:diacylglycerol kinase family enzyme